MKTLTILDCIQQTNKPNGGGPSWRGRLDGCTKLTMCKDGQVIGDEHDLSGVAMIHVEIGKDAQVGTKKQRTAAFDRIGRIVTAVNRKRRSVRKLWYAPRALRAEFHARNAKAIKDWDDENAALAEMGFPGEGVSGVFVDLYDFDSIIGSRVSRFTHAMGQWTSRKIKAVPIVQLRMRDTGRILTLEEARELITLAYLLSSTGEVAVFDVKLDETVDDYETCPIGRIIETIAKEGIGS